jgi:hypothetical protein
MNNLENRYKVDLHVSLAWQDRQGRPRRASARCLNLSASGAHVETIDPLTPQSSVIVHSDAFGRMGHATVRYCFRLGMKYRVGLHFSSSLTLGEDLRQEIVERRMRKSWR